MSFWQPAPPPPTSLGWYRALAKSAAIHASPIALGGMSLGDRWEAIGVTPNSVENSMKLLDAYFDNGGNFIDVANHYQSGQSEEILGEWMEKRKIRDQIILVTKYTQADHKAADPNVKQRVNYIGNNKKSMHLSLAESLTRLRTHYIDIFYVHWWDFETSIEEVMNSLHALVMAGKVLYLGASDMPAWVVAKANQYAIDHGKTQFSIYTGAWNVMDRSFEDDIIPMARDFDMALAPWNVLAGGKFRSDEEEEKRRQNGEKGRNTSGAGWERTEEEIAVSRALEKVAKEVGAHSLGAVAIAYLFHKYHRVFPVVGGRKVEHLLSNVEAIDIKLTPEQITFIESQKPRTPAFPHNMLGDGLKNNILLDVNTTVARLPPRGIIEPKGLSKN